MHFENYPSPPKSENCPHPPPTHKVPKGRAADQSCEFTQQGPGHPPLALPPPSVPLLAPPPQDFLCSLPLVPAEFHLPLTLDASWPLTSLPALLPAQLSPFKCPAPGASPCPSPVSPALHSPCPLAPTQEKLWLKLPPSSHPAVPAPVQMLCTRARRVCAPRLPPGPRPPQDSVSHMSSGLSLTPALPVPTPMSTHEPRPRVGRHLERDA